MSFLREAITGSTHPRQVKDLLSEVDETISVQYLDDARSAFGSTLMNFAWSPKLLISEFMRKFRWPKKCKNGKGHPMWMGRQTASMIYSSKQDQRLARENQCHERFAEQFTQRQLLDAGPCMGTDIDGDEFEPHVALLKGLCELGEGIEGFCLGFCSGGVERLREEPTWMKRVWRETSQRYRHQWIPEISLTGQTW